MGYRSDVRIIVSKKGYEKFKEYFMEYFNEKIKSEEDKINAYNLLEHIDIKSENEDYVYFGWNYVKWYDGIYMEVDAVMNSLYKLAENDYSYRYARIGEQYDDIEEQNFDSEKEGYLEYPYIIREFDDNII